MNNRFYKIMLLSLPLMFANACEEHDIQQKIDEQSYIMDEKYPAEDGGRLNIYDDEKDITLDPEEKNDFEKEVDGFKDDIDKLKKEQNEAKTYRKLVPSKIGDDAFQH